MPRSSFRSLLVGVLAAVAVVLLTGSATAQDVGTDSTTTTTGAPATTTTARAPETTTTQAPAVTTTTEPALNTVTPIVECSFLDTETGMYNTVWGYRDTVTKDIVVPVGLQNSFDNPSANAGQPTTFKPGREHNVFTVTHKGSSTWTLTGETATAPGQACKTNPVPVVADGAGGLVVIIAVTLLMGTVLFWRVRRSAHVRPRRA